MEVEAAAKSKAKGDIHYMNAPTSYSVKENFGGYSDDFDVLAFAGEDLEIQEYVYQSFQNNSLNGTNQASSSSGSRSHDNHDSFGERCFSSATMLDEYLARQLQEELKLDGTANASSAGTARAEASTTSTLSATSDHGRRTARTSAVMWDDGIDPDNMSYEELQGLGEAIGTESRGLSEHLIAHLPWQKYKKGLFSKKDKLECTICCEEYKYRDKVMTLPCKHHYHKDCITPWLRRNKTCPVCKEELFGS